MEIQSDQNDDDEVNHWNNVMRTFLYYEDFVIFDLERRQRHLNKLPNQYSARLPPISFDKINLIDEAAKTNQCFFEDMVHYHVYSNFNNRENNMDPNSYLTKIPSKDKGPLIRFEQQHRNQAVLHSFYREWSREGLQERTNTFDLLINQLKLHLPLTSYSYDKKVLVPGCGLGRLPLEIASLGYKCEGNEFSAFMAIASNFILNGISKANQYSIHPWINNVSNVINANDILQGINVPDISASELLGSDFQNSSATVDIDDYPRFSMAAGDFVEVYGPKNFLNTRKVDAIVTCFFLDTAPVVFDYIETILHALTPGGLWINLGPLLYHWEKDEELNNDPRYEQSLELSYEELKYVVERYGFEYLHESWQDCSYTKCNNSMMWTTYRAVLFTVRKPFDVQSTQASRYCHLSNV